MMTSNESKAGETPAPVDVSIIVPVFNEAENLTPLCTELTDVLTKAALDFEIIFVDDGSTDAGPEELHRLAAADPRVKVIELRRNFGQTAAMAAGIDHCRGRVIVPIDADLQNDPRDIPKLLDVLSGPPAYDIVSGWRRRRKDKWLTRRVPSQIANAMIRRFTHVPIHDFGCTLKAYRRDTLDGISLSSDLHRFLPALAVWSGAKITEVEVNHRPRAFGRTKYGLMRTLRVVLDLVTVKFLGSYMTRPLFFFGKLAIVPIVLSLGLLLIAIGQKFGHFGQPGGLNLNRNILVSLSALLVFLAVQCILLGILSELLTRIYHDIRGVPIYRVSRIEGQLRARTKAEAGLPTTQTPAKTTSSESEPTAIPAAPQPRVRA